MKQYNYQGVPTIIREDHRKIIILLSFPSFRRAPSLPVWAGESALHSREKEAYFTAVTTQQITYWPHLISAGSLLSETETFRLR